MTGEIMKSGKQKRAELKAARSKKAEKVRVMQAASPTVPRPNDFLPLGGLFAPYAGQSYCVPSFIQQGGYAPIVFRCKACGVESVWTAKQQKWWYEEAHGNIWSTAVRCAPCRAKERDRRAAARQTMLAGMAQKNKTKLKSSQ